MVKGISMLRSGCAQLKIYYIEGLYFGHIVWCSWIHCPNFYIFLHFLSQWLRIMCLPLYLVVKDHVSLVMIWFVNGVSYWVRRLRRAVVEEKDFGECKRYQKLLESDEILHFNATENYLKGFTSFKPKRLVCEKACCYKIVHELSSNKVELLWELVLDRQ